MSPISILIVEDNPVHQRLLQAFAKSAQVSYKIVNTGQQALECVFKDNGFDMVFMDCIMPDFSGLDCTRRIRELELGTNKHVPIIAITAMNREDIESESQSAGIDDILLKPFCASEFAEMIKKHHS
ncbi:MAG: response regulator [Candidatus Obscuribacter sp.]|jgi:CheY-like chemotaxis protein|nr:response regulator [Candidatus Obscuribacter sp.]